MGKAIYKAFIHFHWCYSWPEREKGRERVCDLEMLSAKNWQSV